MPVGHEPIQYIRLTEDMRFDVLKGRKTVLEKDAPGFLLTGENIPRLIDVSEKQKSDCFDMLNRATKCGLVAALISGFPCIIGKHQFVKIPPPKMYPVSGEII